MPRPHLPPPGRLLVVLASIALVLAACDDDGRTTSLEEDGALEDMVDLSLDADADTAADTSDTTPPPVASFCGDGVVDDGEACDDGNQVVNDGCLPDCTEAACGDGIVGPGEGCDDGNDLDTDACTNACALPSCGDGVVQAGEACNDGNADDSDACLSTCVAARCGDGVVQDGEACDTMGASATCTVRCTVPMCGDGVVNAAAGEQCDTAGETSGCNADCTTTACGDGIVNAAAGEQCDDGNTADGDDCTATCLLPDCMNGVQDGDETDVDCGGALCAPCTVGGSCSSWQDCDDVDCVDGICQQFFCTDGELDPPWESDVDCGGGACPACVDGLRCGDDSHCQSGLCDSGRCAPLSCANGTLDGDESDVDCGGSCGAGCAQGEACLSGTDCLTGQCTAGTCGAPLTSCGAIKAALPGATTGTWTIDPDGAAGTIAALDVWCDMDSDGGVGHTMVRFDDASLGSDQQAYRDLCASHGMEIIVPRTREHALAIRDWNGSPPSLVGIYPQFDGASGLENWEAQCQGVRGCSFWVSNSRNASPCGGNEPNGDNNTTDGLLLREIPSFFNANCPFGRWNDANQGVSVQGWVVCSPNDADPELLPSCLQYLERDRGWTVSDQGISGDYPSSAGGTITCDMTTDGGGWTVLADDDFDDGVAGAWTPSLVDTTDCGLELGGGVLGGPGNFGTGVTATATYDLSTVPHTELEVSLDVVAIDDWNGEQARVFVDHQLVWLETFDATQYHTNVCGAAFPIGGDPGVSTVSWSDAHTAGTLQLSVGTTLDEAATNESFGVDNVRVRVR